MLVNVDFQSSNNNNNLISVVVIPVSYDNYLTNGPTLPTSTFNFYAIN